MIHSRTGARQPALHIGMLFSVVSALVASVSAAPGDAFNLIQDLKQGTVSSCASGSADIWTVGLNSSSSLLTFIHSDGRAYAPRDTKINSAFYGGNCLEYNSSTVFYISDVATGSMIINPATNIATWNDATLSKTNSVDQKKFQRNTTAIGVGQQGVPTMMTIPEANNIAQWPANGPSSGITNLIALKAVTADNGNTPIKYSDIIDMACFNDSLYIHYNTGNNKGARIYMVKPTEAGTQNSARSPIPVSANAMLVRLSDNNGVALINRVNSATLNVTYPGPDGTGIGTPVAYQVPDSADGLLVVGSNEVRAVNPTGVGSFGPVGAGGKGDGGVQPPGVPGTPLPPPQNQDPHPKSANHLPAIIGGVIGGLALAVIVVFLVIRRRRTTRGGKNTTGRSLFSGKRQQDLFPAKTDDSLVPLGIYNQEHSLPPRHQDDDPERMGYMSHQGGVDSRMRSVEPERTAFLRNSTQPSMDETIPVEAALAHYRHDQHTPQGLHHSISVSSVTSRFPRHSAKSGKLFEEKIQLQVIRYETQDAHLMAPHGAIGRLVLGTYHIISGPKSARSVKPHGGNIQGLARSGTVVVRKNRASIISGVPSGRNSPLVEMAEESSMLLTDAENQHTFEGVTLKWYMTEIHWKREAALLKRLKSPIFVMELLESYCIPALQNRAFTYPFVNAMGGRSSLLSNLSPVKTAQHTRAILRSISAAVEWCHRHGVVHLNIQPGSFFLEDDIDPRTEDASWKLWDFTCARYIGERIGVFGGSGESVSPSHYQPPSNPANPDSFPYLDQQQHDRQMDRIGGNPLPAAYTAPELLEAWRANDTNFPVEAGMDTWSLGCLYYEILTGYPLFPTETEAWGLVGGWEQTGPWSIKNFRVPYPPSPSSEGIAPATSESESNSPYERSQTLDPSGSIAKLLRNMMTVQPEERVSLETIMERIY